jgi:hypothetical protein
MRRGNHPNKHLSTLSMIARVAIALTPVFLQAETKLMYLNNIPPAPKKHGYKITLGLMIVMVMAIVAAGLTDRQKPVVAKPAAERAGEAMPAHSSVTTAIAAKSPCADHQVFRASDQKCYVVQGE